MEEKSYINIAFLWIVKYLNKVNFKLKSKFKVSTWCHRNNADTKNTTVLMIALVMSSVFFFKLSAKTNINYKKKMSIIISTGRIIPKQSFDHSSRVIGFNWSCLFLSVLLMKRHQLRNVEKFTLSYFVIFKLFYSSGWTHRSFVKCMSNRKRIACSAIKNTCIRGPINENTQFYHWTLT